MNVFLFVAVITWCVMAWVPASAQISREYHLSVAPEHLYQLNSNPWLDTYVPGVLAIDGVPYDCEVRYRGGSTRNAPKKSWKIKFRNTDNPLGAEKLNLTTQYYDPSLLRHYLATKLYERLGQNVPTAQYANVYLNGNYAGVYLDVENVDDVFFTRRDLSTPLLVKAESHAARFVQLLNSHDYKAAWEQDIGGLKEYRDFIALISLLGHLPDTALADTISAYFDTEQVLTYFAVEYVFAAQDNITKNFFVYQDGRDHRYRIIPWDNDAILGNNYEGRFDSLGYGLSARKGLFLNNLLFQRMLDVPEFRSRFIQLSRQVAVDGLSYMANVLDTMSGVLRADIYRDTSKCCSNEMFEQSIEEIKYFLSKRRVYLELTEPKKHVLPTELTCSHAFARVGDTVIFRAAVPSSTVSEFYVRMALDADFGQPADSMAFILVPLFDDGQHSDGAPGDKLFAGEYVVPPQVQTILPYTFVSPIREYPAGGLFHVQYEPAWTPAIVLCKAQEIDYARLDMVEAIRVQDDYALVFVNSSAQILDLSYSAIRANNPLIHWLFPPGTALAPGDTLVVTTNAPALRHLRPHAAVVVESMLSGVAEGDALALLGPDSRELAHYIVVHVQDAELPLYDRVVINEVRFSSSTATQGSDGGDWVELYNTGDNPVLLYGWTLSDSDDSHVFVFPPDCVLEPQGYLVVCVDSSAFDAVYPGDIYRVGDVGFSLGSTDAVRLFDVSGRLVDSVTYGDTPSWPAVADTQTLELVNPSADNSNPIAWNASFVEYGTPGRENSAVLRDSGAMVPLVISEINYVSPETMDAGDWVEIYNPTDSTAHLEGWILADEDADHAFRFPAGMSIAPQGFAVVVRRPDRFAIVHPGVNPYKIAGPMGFGLSSSGGEVRLLNAVGVLVDSVCYGVNTPWPVLPDSGATLELVHAALDNTLPESWKVSAVSVGTPAEPNTSWASGALFSSVESHERISVVPLPVQSVAVIAVPLRQAQHIVLEVFDLYGRHVAAIFEGISNGAPITWDASSLAPGLYVLQCRLQSGGCVSSPFVKAGR